MNRKTVYVTFLLLAFASNSVLTCAYMRDAWAWDGVPVDDSLNKLDIEVSESTAYVPVPFHYQDTTYYCGPAALEMVFDYYGEDIPQIEIADAANTYYDGTFIDHLRRAAHFSNLSTSVGDEMPGSIAGYSARTFGYAAFEQWGLTIDNLKSLIDTGEPTVLLMWYDASHVSGHYRVVVGYNETHILTHDPWNRDAWGGTYGGANTSITYSAFLDLWTIANYWGLWVRPWDIHLQCPSTVNQGDEFEVTANITYACSPPFPSSIDYPASSCQATIELTGGLALASGESAQHWLGTINARGSVQTSWSVLALAGGFENISVRATGIIDGYVSQGLYYEYEDTIGGVSVTSLAVEYACMT